MEKLMLIDGNSLANRAFYAISSLANSEGFATNAIFGFLNMLSRARKEEKPDRIAVAFDAGKKVFRHDMYENYKGSRKSTPEELRAQFPVLREVLSAMGVPWLETEGYEADDLIGTLASMGSRAGMAVRIITGDRDCFQLIDGNTAVLFTRRGITELERFDESHLREAYGLEPWQIVELKGLMGDSSDDIPGVPGVGEKTALKLLADHQSVEGVLAAAGEYAGKKLGEKLTEYGDLARLSRRLAEICREAPLSLGLEDLKPTAGNVEEKIRLFRRLEFKGLLAEAIKERDAGAGGGMTGSSGAGKGAEKGGVPGAAPASEGGVDGTDGMAAPQSSGTAAGETGSGGVEAAPEAALDEGGQMNLFGSPGGMATPPLSVGAAGRIEGVNELAEYLAPLKDGGRLYVLPAIQGQSRRSFSWLGLGLMREGWEAVWLSPSEAADGDTDGFWRDALSVLKPWLGSASVTKIFIDAKQAYLHFMESGACLTGPYEDLHLMSYLADPANPWRMLPGLEELEPDLLARSLKEAAKSGEAFWNAAKAGRYLAAMEFDRKELKTYLEACGLWPLYKDAEEPLALILGDMERQGILIAPGVLREQGEGLKEKIDTAEKEIHGMAGRAFNINSPKQLGEILFDQMGLPRGKKTKTGYSTDADTLEYLAGEYEIAGRILEYRQYAKLQSTYVEGLLAIMDRASNRIHSSLNQTITVTGRLSSTEPNLQNIPVRLEEGRRIRRAFIPSPGCVFLSGDYSQIELRILAHFCGDEALRRAFAEGQDIHRSTAAEVFGVDPRDVTAQQRRAAKTVNFGMIYGISDFGLAQDLGIDRGEAKAYMERYFDRYPGVRVWFDRLLLEAADRGYVETLFHRRRYLPELKSRNYHVRGFGQRAAMNAPLQGTAADIMKLAMIAVRKILDREGLGTTMILQVHDELLFDMPEDKAASLKNEIKTAMEGAAILAVPLLVDMKTGRDWYSMDDD